MTFAILCYHAEEKIVAWTAEQEAQVMADLATVQQRIAQRHPIGPVARLQPTTTAKTLRNVPGKPLVVDGPFAETKEHLLGFYLIDCPHIDDALQAARELGAVNPGGSYEVRPVLMFRDAASA